MCDEWWQKWEWCSEIEKIWSEKINDNKEIGKKTNLFRVMKTLEIVFAKERTILRFTTTRHTFTEINPEIVTSTLVARNPPSWRHCCSLQILSLSGRLFRNGRVYKGSPDQPTQFLNQVSLQILFSYKIQTAILLDTLLFVRPISNPSIRETYIKSSCNKYDFKLFNYRFN